ncbi:MAG: 30S ribosomal protein S19 [Nanoarchaeota archaeon]|nr:30S ribosomal protein S19 [Nanoarchaeota archaeon]
MARKEFTYRGKTLKELQDLSLNEFIELIPARQRRSLNRGFTDEQKKLVGKLSKKDNVKTHVRDLVILPQMVGRTILVHNGKTYTKVFIDQEMIGHVLGELSLTRNRVAHSSPGVGATKSSSNVSVK